MAFELFLVSQGPLSLEEILQEAPVQTVKEQLQGGLAATRLSKPRTRSQSTQLPPVMGCGRRSGLKNKHSQSSYCLSQQCSQLVPAEP